MDYVLTTESVGKQYKQFKALNGLSMHVPKGAIYGFVGKNGACKTTLIRLICGLQEPTSGSYTLFGIRNDAKNFSLGMKQRLGIAVALAGDPDLLVLDEPINGLDPQGIIEMRELILKLNRERQITVLISSHILDELSRLATHYGIIDGGRMVKEISAEELDSVCRKCIRVEVTDTKALVRVLDEMKIDYKILSENQADVFAKINISQLTMALVKEKCELISVKERDESLES